MGADNQQLGHEVPFFIVSECPTPQLCAGSDRRRQGPKTLTVAADGADRPLHPVQDWPVMGILATVVNVFVDEAGEHGNPLGIVWASTATRGHEQDIAAALGFSETVFIDEVDGRTVRARIFTPKQELRFAGHPTVGLAAWLRAAGDDIRHVVVPAGSARVRADGDLTWISADVDWAPEFELERLDSPGEVDAVDPDAYTEGMHYVWAWLDEEAGRVRTRMFAPGLGIRTDEATGSAAIRLTAALGRDLQIEQGAGPRLVTHRRNLGREVEIGGRTTPGRDVELA